MNTEHRTEKKTEISLSNACFFLFCVCWAIFRDKECVFLKNLTSSSFTAFSISFFLLDAFGLMYGIAFGCCSDLWQSVCEKENLQSFSLVFLSKDSVGRKSEGDIVFTKQPSLKEGILGGLVLVFFFIVCLCVVAIVSAEFISYGFSCCDNGDRLVVGRVWNFGNSVTLDLLFRKLSGIPFISLNKNYYRTWRYLHCFLELVWDIKYRFELWG